MLAYWKHHTHHPCEIKVIIRIKSGLVWQRSLVRILRGCANTKSNKCVSLNPPALIMAWCVVFAVTSLFQAKRRSANSSFLLVQRRRHCTNNKLEWFNVLRLMGWLPWFVQKAYCLGLLDPFKLPKFGHIQCSLSALYLIFPEHGCHFEMCPSYLELNYWWLDKIHFLLSMPIPRMAANLNSYHKLGSVSDSFFIYNY